MTHSNFLNLVEAELDQHVYRIMRQDFVIALFTEQKNVLSQVHNWKDRSVLGLATSSCLKRALKI